MHELETNDEYQRDIEDIPDYSNNLPRGLFDRIKRNWFIRGIRRYFRKYLLINIFCIIWS